MKKIIFLSAIALLCASMVFAIAQKDLAALKGTWQGTATGGGGGTCNVTIEIMNDTEPLQGKMTFTNIPAKVKTDWALTEPHVTESNDGKITSAGTIMFTGPTGFFEITKIAGNKLSGWGYSMGFKGDVSATKK